ncbi:MAG: sigma 54-interacting transcriptional regulator, partial [Oscillospiraceae bacterium]|nr:sigma 54-interacting transcriptional regulator [Oscillospiraceae bacterium]
MDQKTLQTNPDLYKIIFESIYDGIAVLDKNMDYIAVNPAFLNLTGFTKEEIIGKNLIELKGTDVQAPTALKTKKPIDGIGPSLIIHKKRMSESDAFSYTTKKLYTYTAVAPIIVDDIAVGTVTTFKILEDVRKKIDDYTRSIKQMRNQLASLHKAQMTFQSIIGESPAIKKAILIAQKAADSEASILLTGESGTGKEVFAQAIHNASPRAEQPFVTLNCPCLPESLAESELFGYEDGAFSGAAKGGKIGLYETADHGTLFLDEIGDLDITIQTKILRVLENGQFMQIGGRKPIDTNVRIISATNRNLTELMHIKKFREDLFYRLCVVAVEIPPLRERKSDIPLLAQKFVDDFSQHSKTFDEKTLQLFSNYSWRGNIRELRNIVLAMVNTTDSSVLTPAHLPDRLKPTQQSIAFNFNPPD